MAKQKKSVEANAVDHLSEALATLDGEQDAIEDKGSQLFADYRQSREKLKALIKYVNARLY